MLLRLDHQKMTQNNNDPFSAGIFNPKYQFLAQKTIFAIEPNFGKRTISGHHRNPSFSSLGTISSIIIIRIVSPPDPDESIIITKRIQNTTTTRL